MTTAPLLTLWEFAPPSGAVVRLTSSPPVRPEQTPFPQRGVWIGGTPWYCCGISVSGVERASGEVSVATLSVQLNPYLEARRHILAPGVHVVRYQSDARAVDPANWASGVNPYGTPQQVDHRIDRWVISRVTSEEAAKVTLAMREESADWKDLVRLAVPGRCYHHYRGAACGYTGTSYWDAQGDPVTDAEADSCGLRLSDCRLRFPAGNLPYGEG